MDGIGLCVEAWIAFFNKKHLVHRYSIFVPHGPPKGVYQSLSSCVQQCVCEDVRQYSQHNPSHTDHMKINKPRIVDLRLATLLLLAIFCSNFLLTKMGCMVMPMLWLRSCICLLTALADVWCLTGRLTLTTRLSFTCWSSTPDEISLTNKTAKGRPYVGNRILKTNKDGMIYRILHW